ncbi:DUF2752 domain-containing protein [[Clostridium] polysaccharolyticum]|uniref:DUF2752 domain-containing protein n=1 Tax=[Clostridium] polysaccharolyticum TaxID=29364 RepID=UPI000B81B4A9
MKTHKQKLGIVIISGLLYYVWIRCTKIGIPCPFYKITHLKCPGCGITRMFYYLFCFQWKKAMAANYFLFWTCPIILIFILYEQQRKYSRRKADRIWTWLETGYVITLIIWMIVRNRINI